MLLTTSYRNYHLPAGVLRTFRHTLLCALVLLPTAKILQAQITVEAEAQPVSIETPHYSARVEPDGCLTNFSVSGLQFLAPGVGISRGSYFYLDGPLALPEVSSHDGNTVEAHGDKASITYQFDEAECSWHLTNKTEQQLVFFIVFNGYVGAVRVGDQDIEKTALVGDYTQATFFLGKSKLSVEGFDKLWGPWQGPHQVVQTTLKAGEERTLTFQPGEATEEEILKALQLFVLPDPEPLMINSPRELQVIQRSNRDMGRVLVSGRTRTDADTVEIRFVGEQLGEEHQQWQSIPLISSTRSFHTWIDLPAGGWYGLESRALNKGEAVAEAKVQQFGIGEVFVGAGQSNSTNSGQFKIQQSSGMVSSFSGSHWQIADDPQPGVADRTQGGSFWPAFGDAMYAKFKVPIGVATTGYGGTSVNQWQPDGDLFQRWMMARIHQLGPRGFRAVLWHQGESDVNMPAEEYFQKLKNTITASKQNAGWEFPWFVAIASYHNAEQPRFESVRSAQQKLCDEGIALLGPDTDVLTGDHRDLDGQGIHLSPKGLKAHGQMWAEKVASYVEEALSTTAENPSHSRGAE